MMGLSIKPCPPAGQGVHQWVYHAYCRLREDGFSDEYAKNYCEENATRELRPGDIPSIWPARETSSRRNSAPTVFSLDLLRRVAAKCPDFGIDQIKARSPVDLSIQTTQTFLRSLFTSGERVLLFEVYESQGQLLWSSNVGQHLLDRFKRPVSRRGSWLLINPVTGAFSNIPRRRSAFNPSGSSRRCVENLTTYRYLLLESDVVDPPEAPALWIAVLAQLPLPIVSITSSGGKSVHALVKVDATSLDEWRSASEQIAEITVPLGADRAPLNSPAYLSRLPGCFREEKQTWQELLYLNPHADGTPLCQLAERKLP